MFKLAPGVTMFVPGTGPAHDPERPHLYVVLTHPCPDGKIMVVPICTAIGNKFDRTCVLRIGDHPFIEKDSYIAYHHMDTFVASVVERQVRERVLKPDVSLTEAVLARVRAGVAVSRQSTPANKKYFEEQMKRERAAKHEAAKRERVANDAAKSKK
jgi:hypothetical protein